MALAEDRAGSSGTSLAATEAAGESSRAPDAHTGNLAVSANAEISSTATALVEGDAAPPVALHLQPVPTLVTGRSIPSHGGPTYIVFGVPVQEHGVRKMMRRVIVLAALAATFYIVHFIYNLMSGAYDTRNGRNASHSLWTGMSSLVIELSIPACGYYGAVHANRQLACCFCSCNLFVTVLGIVSFIRLLRFTGDCAQEKNAQQRRACEVWQENDVDKFVMITGLILGTCLGSFAVWFGGSLYKVLAQDVVASGQPPFPLIGEVVPLDSVIGILAGAEAGEQTGTAASVPPEAPPEQTAPRHSGLAETPPVSMPAAIGLPSQGDAPAPGSTGETSAEHAFPS